MKKFNLFQEIIVVDKASLLQAINSSKTFGITIDAQITYAPFSDTDIIIFEGKHTPKPTSALAPAGKPSFEEILGVNYQIVEDDDRVLIKAFSNWQEIIGMNVTRASYDDTTADGVAEFSNKELETIGWHATEFNVPYRDMIDHLEDKCSGTLLCIEQEEPYKFSGLGFLADDEEAKKVLFDFCRQRAKKLIQEDPLYAKENLNEDETEAAEFFKLL